MALQINNRRVCDWASRCFNLDIKMEREHTVKVVIIGDTSVGKSNIISRYVNNEFGKCQTTMGCQFAAKKLEIGGSKIKLMVWDTAGQERYKSVSQVYYKGAAAVILVYDITNMHSFQNLAMWYDQAVSNSASQVIKIVVANKMDLQSNREVTRELGELFAVERNIGFREVSAASGANINSVFQFVVDKYLQKISDRKISPPTSTVRLSNVVVTEQRRRRSCCFNST